MINHCPCSKSIVFSDQHSLKAEQICDLPVNFKFVNGVWVSHIFKNVLVCPSLTVPILLGKWKTLTSALAKVFSSTPVTPCLRPLRCLLWN